MIHGDPLDGFTVHTWTPSDNERRILDMDHAETLGYVRPSDEWVDEHGEPLPDELQIAAHSVAWLLDEKYGAAPTGQGPGDG